MALHSAYLTMHRWADTYFARNGVAAGQFVLLRLLADEGAVRQQQLVARSNEPFFLQISSNGDVPVPFFNRLLGDGRTVMRFSRSRLL
jgi:hypothetical protein